MKRLTAAWCTLAVFICCFSALAEDMSTGLPEITLKVKETLDIGDEYTDFSGSNYNGVWDLYWSGDDREISVTCDADGKVFNYYTYSYDYVYESDYAPRYPSIEKDELERISGEFLDRVINSENEGWTIESVDSSLQHGSEARVSILGRLLLCDKPTDTTFDLTIDTGSGQVTSFYRSDSYMKFADIGIDMSEAITAEEARQMLHDTVQLELVYYAADSDESAQLLYMPTDTSRHIVRACDGELINMDEAYNELYGNEYTEDTVMEAGQAGYSEERKLTDAELAGISVYDGAMSVDELDVLIRSMQELGIGTDFYITSANYYEHDDMPVALLRYARLLTDTEKDQRGCAGDHDQYDTKYLTINAAEGKLISIYSSYAGQGNDLTTLAEDGLQKAADSFIEKYFPEYAAAIAADHAQLNDDVYSWNSTYDVWYVRSHNGYLFRENWISVDVNAATGCIDRFDINWNDDQQFREYAAGDILTEDAAKESYLTGFEFEAGFANLPVGTVNEWDMLYEKVFCWQLRDVSGVYAVDAETGELLADSDEGDTFVYDDISGHEYEAAISQLGSFGVGYSGGEFSPDTAFTAKDALTFIVQAAQYRYEGVEERSFDSLAETADELGAAELKGYAENDILTRGEFAGALVCMSGYRKAAALTGIYDCSFTDDKLIAGNDYGKIAIAYALGLIKTDADGCINADAELTRGEAAQIFHKLLSIR